MKRSVTLGKPTAFCCLEQLLEAFGMMLIKFMQKWYIHLQEGKHYNRGHYNYLM